MELLSACNMFPDYSVNPFALEDRVVIPDFSMNVIIPAGIRMAAGRADYSFENYIAGPENQFAVSAATNIAANPGQSYNPLFIHGGVGLGKTHLMKAIGHEVGKANPGFCIVETSAEKIVNEFVACLFSKNMPRFREKFRRCDVLLIDDIQCLTANQEKTQTELFHAFNALYEAKKQVVFVADVPPGELPGIENRLKSRFEWGLTVDIQPPDLVTRIAIIESIADREAILIPPEVAVLVAERFTRNVRQLIGGFNLLVAKSRFLQLPLSTNLARSVYDCSPMGVESTVSVDQIQRETARCLNVSIPDLIGKKRFQQFVIARQIAIYLARTLTKASYTEIARQFGGRDHTTILHAVKKIQREMESNALVKGNVLRIRQKLGR